MPKTLLKRVPKVELIPTCSSSPNFDLYLCLLVKPLSVTQKFSLSAENKLQPSSFSNMVISVWKTTRHHPQINIPDINIKSTYCQTLLHCKQFKVEVNLSKQLQNIWSVQTLKHVKKIEDCQRRMSEELVLEFKIRIGFRVLLHH